MVPIYRGRSKRVEERTQGYIVIKVKNLDQNSEQNNNSILHRNSVFQSAPKFMINLVLMRIVWGGINIFNSCF